ncbi:MAG: chromosome segregation protein SMC, partial [Lachnospiraceae bacterium]|nr:chromosome segregation protein SMC [Lachnospiraceae bacterium]
MYLKSIEMHGFKSFANKIVLEFHDGITGIVGPNGSGKSNVADAVRWVLGEQSARQLRGASMQDVIFAGTQNRNPLSYAYVAITLDNSDHMLPIDFEEVTIARRVYRSGESEYLLNGSPCRLKDVNELFFDTGIGKEGYSIIGQGQIERILSGKPEERRELFDEAVGIVKYKKRKAASIKKLEEERENLVRVNDILAELERQVGPLEEQAQTAKLYLKRKEELKTYDVNMFLLEISRLNQLLDEINKNYRITDEQLQSQKEEDERIRVTYASLEEQLEAVDAQIDSLKDEESKTSIAKSQLENEIKLLEEQIRFAQSSEENTAKRKAEIESEKEAFEKEKEGYEQQNAELTELLNEAVERLNKAKEYFANLENEINACNEGIERDNREMLALINGRSEIKSKEQKYSTMTEQINIRKAQLNQRLLARKTEENQLQAEVEKAAAAYDEIRNKTEELEQNQKEIETKIHDSKDRIRQANIALQEAKDAYNKESSRLESLKNIAERYDGYGKSIRSVMEQKDKNSGIHGVIADLIHVQKKYEIAIETALGGNIQNIVTEDEETAKRMIDFLKKNHLGRATFLPITSVDGRGNFKKTEVLDDKGVIGLASELVDCDSQYEGVIAYLLGRVVVTKTVDDALALARKNKYSLHIVTLEGEYLSPGGSISGGAFRNNSNLLGRHREIDDMEKRLEELAAKQKEMDQDILGRQAAIALLEDDLDENRKALSAAAVERNTAEINLARSKELMKESENAFQSLNTEGADIEKQLAEIEKAQKDIAGELEAS